MLIHQLLERQADEDPSRILVMDRQESASYSDIERESNRIAQALMRQGVRLGDRIGLLAVNSPFYISAYYGILKTGAIVVSLNAAGRWCDHMDLLERCGAVGLVSGRRMLRQHARSLDTTHLAFVFGHRDEWDGIESKVGNTTLFDWDDINDQCSLDRPKVRIAPEARAAIVYTSGSTGSPKGVTLTHRNVVANTRSITSYLELTRDDRVLVILPFHYVYGKSLLNTHVAVGGSVVIENRFLFPQTALDTLESSEATGLSGVPSTFAILLNRSNFEHRDLTHLRYVTQAGGAMAPELQRRLCAAIPGRNVFIMYGATEAAARLSYLDPSCLPDKAGSIGKAIPGVDLRVLRENGTETNVDEEGELVASGPNIMEGYWDDEPATAEVIDQAGYHTGDLARRDAEGFLYIVGRKREMIKAGAHRIAPKEIEEKLAEHTAVHESAVVGVADEMLGEAIVAFVTFKPDANADVAELLRWCKLKLPSHKVPTRLESLDQLPRNASGKVDKLALKSMAQSKLAAPIVVPSSSTVFDPAAPAAQ